jgi:trimethylamine--corrinoid protein Co-methyltransferase
LADRRSPAQWEQAGAHDLRTVARQRTLDLLATYFPRHLDSETEAHLRAGWDIKLTPQEMHAP